MSKVRKYLSTDGLLDIVRHSFDRERFPETRSNISLQDCIMTGLAVFCLKYPSLLQFENNKTKACIENNLKNLYHVKHTPSDTCLRERLDVLPVEHFRKPFKNIFSVLQRGKMLERFKYLNDSYLISIDGTGQYSSKKIKCDNCCEKHHKNGEVSYYHQMLGAVLLHPKEKVVIPLAPESIKKEDGEKKNDCERNAAKRMLIDFRREHPHLKAIIVEDALYANHPHLELLEELNLQYIIGVKESDHSFLFDWVKYAKGNEFIVKKSRVIHKFRYVNDVPLSDKHINHKVNVIEYWEEKADGQQQYFSWITSLDITDNNVFALMEGGRARWKIENETFNTLKNQGYNFEHNYGHGNKNLCSVMTMLMMLAFLIDQVQQLCSEKYQALRKKIGSLRTLFEEIRVLIKYFIWENWEMLYKFMLFPQANPPPLGIFFSK